MTSTPCLKLDEIGLECQMMNQSRVPQPTQSNFNQTIGVGLNSILQLLGVSNDPIQFKIARKITNLQKLDECSLARARKIFANARILRFLLKFP